MNAQTIRRSSACESDGAIDMHRTKGRVVLIDDDRHILEVFSDLLALEGHACETYDNAALFLADLADEPAEPAGPRCVVCDVHMPGMDGLELQRRLAQYPDFALVLVSGISGAHEAVTGFRAGALDFLLKPVESDALLAAVARALDASAERQRARARALDVSARISTLTDRELEVARGVARGRINRLIAEDLGIALRTVKQHRQRAMEKLGVATTVDLARVMDEAGGG